MDTLYWAPQLTAGSDSNLIVCFFNPSAGLNTNLTWNGTNWLSQPDPFGSVLTDIGGLWATVRNGSDIYVFGAPKTGLGPRVIKWDGTSWSIVGGYFDYIQQPGADL